MSSLTSSESHACAHCTKIARLICNGCKGLPDGAQGQVGVYYCGALCQKEDWNNHKALCKAAKERKTIYRAGELARSVSTIFFRTIWKIPIAEVKKLGNVWIIYPLTQYSGKYAFSPFPSDMFPRERDAAAILDFQCCSGALDHLHDFIQQLLKGLCTNVDEVNHHKRNTQRRIMLAYNTGQIDATDYAHSIIRVTMKTGEKYVIDLTGAQYGWYETITPWHKYEQSRVQSIKEVQPFGYTRQFCEERAAMSGGQAKWNHDADKSFTKALNDLVASWQAENTSLSAMLKLPEAEFEEEKASFLVTVEDGMQRFGKFMKDIGALDLKGGIIVGALDRKFKTFDGKEVS